MIRLLFVFLMGTTSLFTYASCSSTNPWSQVSLPVNGPAEAIGSYTAGCLKGGETLSPDGEGFQLMRLTRNRFYSHPNLVRYIQELGKKIKEHQLGTMLVGDMAQPRGGPMESGHASHQLGLDVDIWFDFKDERHKSLSLLTRESLSATAYVDLETLTLKENWKPAHDQLVKFASQSFSVERVFVNPAIKRHLCRKHPEATWLRKVRPWWGHHDHLHVRLQCPAGNEACESQTPPPEGTGCDKTLDWWFSQEAQEEAERIRELPAREVVLPKACDELL